MTPEIWIGIGMACAIAMIYGGLHWDRKKTEKAAAKRREERIQSDKVMFEARKAKRVIDEQKNREEKKRFERTMRRDKILADDREQREDIGGISMTDAILAATLLDENSNPASHDTAPTCTPEPSTLHTSTSYDTGSSFSSGGGSDFGGGGGGGDSGGGGGGCD